MTAILKEGGNVFKSAEGPLTQRIATQDVHPTIQLLKRLTKLITASVGILTGTLIKRIPNEII